MTIYKATISHLETVKNITVRTINAVYPHYYPSGAVDFFLSHHNDCNIHSDIVNGNVYILNDADNITVGTVTVKANEICRLFVFPEYQGKGYGRELLNYAEKKISEKYSSIILDASLPAKAIYHKRGYVPTDYHSIETENGDYLCYDVMEKKL
ncbi:MAG: GNAT family N-acetyltransferase [Ruminococcus sp.]|nr:GNAT family N-acetyltransferase [Ruminococcus sp.]